MTYDERLENVSILGAAGKMGSGILLLTAVEMANLSLKANNRSKTFILNAVDVSDSALNGVMDYLRSQVRKIAEKNTVKLRKLYEDRDDLIENSEIIDQYIFDVLKIVRTTKVLNSVYESSLVFEAVNENIDLKIKLFSEINKNSACEPWFFTNTSSIPIKEIDEKVGLGGRIIGFHFYNPPAVQRLVELIPAPSTKKELIEFSELYAKSIKKKTVRSNDFAGFIGNGHFMRDALFGLNEALALSKENSLPESIYTINKITQDFLIRPMGIFQLIDYVGIDVCQFIMNVMNPHLPDENLHSSLLDTMMEKRIQGGQNSDGSQKNGFLRYEKGKITGVINPESGDYVNPEVFAEQAATKLGKLPAGCAPWKVVISSSNREKILKDYFREIQGMDTKGAKLTIKFASNSFRIASKLVSDKVAENKDDVNTVLLTGFYHAYGPINDYLNWEEI